MIKDEKITKKEILANWNMFVGSQATNYGEDLTKRHDELWRSGSFFVLDFVTVWNSVTVALIFTVILSFKLTFYVNISIYGSQFSFRFSFHSYTVYMRIEVELDWLCGISFDQDTFFYSSVLY